MNIVSLLTAFGDQMFPRECVVCGARGAWLCALCQPQIPLLIPACPLCRKETAGGMTHHACADHFALQGCLAAASLALSPIERLVYGCKYHGLRSAADALAWVMARALHASPASHAWIEAEKPVLCPIPLHPQRTRTRGYNQSALLAHSLASLLSLPHHALLLRNKFTRDQVKLTREARRENLADAFSAAPEAMALPHAVMLVDDVVTTGATFDAAARALRRIRKDITIWGIAAAYHATL